MYQWSIEKLDLPLQFTWKISRGESQKKTLFFIKLQNEAHTTFGEVAGITTKHNGSDELIQQFYNFKEKNIFSISEVLKLNLPSHLEFGITSAINHMQALEKKISLSESLDLSPAKPLPTSFSLPILPIDEIPDFIRKFELNKFKVLKLKIGEELASEACHKLASLYSGPFRVDANEAFSSVDSFLKFTSEVKSLNIEFIEEPFPRNSWAMYKELKNKTSIPIFADESIQREQFPDAFIDCFHGINVKLMKAGSYQQAIAQIKKAKQMGLKTMLGCMVESSLGIAGAMSLSQDVDYFDLDGFLYFENEPHGLVLENDGLLTHRPSSIFNP